MLMFFLFANEPLKRIILKVVRKRKESQHVSGNTFTQNLAGKEPRHFITGYARVLLLYVRNCAGIIILLTGNKLQII